MNHPQNKTNPIVSISHDNNNTQFHNFTSDQQDSDNDGFETVNDYVLLEQVRDAIEDIQSKSKSKSKSVNVNDNDNDNDNSQNNIDKVASTATTITTISLLDHSLYDKVCLYLEAKSQRTKDRINSVMDEINAHENREVHSFIHSFIP